MDHGMREAINNLTDEIIRVFSIQIPINNIDEVVSRMGGRIVEDDKLSGDSDGLIRRTEDSFEIIVSPFQSPTRRNFTIAHELGHLFLHMGYLTNPKIWKKQENKIYNRSGNSEEEYQANQFAGALLMPKKDYIECMKHNTEGRLVNTLEMASFFNVSLNAASTRGKWLGLLEW